VSMHKRALAAALCVGSLMSLIGCAQQVGDIDRTQPNKLRKEIFNQEDEWYMRSTVVEANATSQTSFAGLQGEMFRVRWEITEDSLVAYKSHEDVIGLDTNQYDAEKDGPFLGRPVAAFGIQGHFDVQRSYNAATGEQSNVISENSSDRPWYEREWLRVDWSRNMAPADESLDPAVEIQQISGLQIAPQDSGLKSDDITWYIDYDEKGEANYLEVVNIYQIYPDWIECLLSYDLAAVNGGSCGVETVKVRTSFMKVDKEALEQHEPRVYTDHELDKFGFFRTGRCVYDRGYGCRDTGQVWLANIWRIWDNARNADGSFKPYEERTPRPFAYYLTANYPEDLIQPSHEIIDQWNEAYVDVVKFYHPDFNGRIFYLCNNPGHPDDPGYKDGVCKNPGVKKELGDLRYSFLSWVDNDQPTGPLGYGPSSPDPLTGELINANANIYGASIDIFVQSTMDLLMLMNGEIDIVDYGYGRNVEEYLERLRDEGLFLGYDDYLQEHAESLENVKEKINLREGRIFELRDAVKGKPLETRLEPLRETADLGHATWNKLRGTELEQLMITDEIEKGIGAPQALYYAEKSGRELTEEERLNLMSPVRMATKRQIMDNLDLRINRFASRNMMMAEFYDDSYLGLATRLKDMLAEGGQLYDADREVALANARRWLRAEIYNSVMEHEVGHTMGLFHNFEGSFDAVNFFPEYWENRFTDYDGDGNLDMIDPSRPLTTAQLATGIREKQYSSIMDYGARFALDISGIGPYDRAAIHYGYGKLLTVFNEQPKKIAVDYANSDWDSVQPTNIPLTRFDDLDEVTGAFYGDGVTPLTDAPATEDAGRLDNGLNFYHYAVLPYIFEGTNGDMSKMYDRSLVRADELADSGKVEVPFRFCSDYYRGGTPSCNVYDEGASFDEIMDSYIRSYEQYYFFNNFRRGRAGWGLWLWPLVQRYLGRYFGPIVNIYQHWVIRLFEFDDQWYVSDWGGRLGWAGIERGLGTIMNTLVSPHPGAYGWDPAQEMWVNISSEEGFRPEPGDAGVYTQFMDVPLGEGKYDFSRYDTDGGHYYFFHYEILTTFFERWMAMAAMTDPTTNFIGVDASSDITAFSIPVTLLYNQEMYRWFGALINGDMSEIGPIVEPGQDGKMTFRSQNPLASNFLRGSYASRQKLNPYSSVYGNRSFNVEYFAMLYGLAWFQDRFDRSFNSVANVRVVGRGDSYDLPEGWQSITWTDPTSGVTYIAGRSDFDAARGTYPTGWNMLAKAKELETQWRDTACPDNETDLADCDVVNAEYFEMSNQRETIDIMALANATFYDWNVQYLPWE
jgi:hypothetical protein